MTEDPITVNYTVTRPRYKTIQGYETVTILPLTLAATAVDAHMYVGEQDPGLTYSVEGEPDGETSMFTGSFTNAFEML